MYFLSDGKPTRINQKHVGPFLHFYFYYYIHVRILCLYNPIIEYSILQFWNMSQSLAQQLLIPSHCDIKLRASFKRSNLSLTLTFYEKICLSLLASMLITPLKRYNSSCFSLKGVTSFYCPSHLYVP